MNSNIEFILNPDILKGIPFDKYEQNFTFIVNGKEFRTSRFLADLLSPTIRQYHSIDETTDRFILDLKEDNSNLTFSDFLKIISFEKTNITQEQLQYYTQILFLLGNRENITKSVPFMNEDITINNVFDRLLYKEKYFQQLSKQNQQESSNFCEQLLFDIPHEPLQEEIDFISSHFSEINQEKLKNLGVSHIESVISNPKLLLENEDSLFQFIASLYSENSSLSYLFENVDFLNISDDCVRHFYEIFDLNDINHSIWSELIKRSISTQKVSPRHNCKQEIRRKEEEEEKERQAQQKIKDEENQYQIILRSSGGRAITVDCKQTDTIQSLYEIVSEEFLIGIESFVLVYEGIRLDRNSTIGSNQIPNGGTIVFFHVIGPQ